MRIPVYEKQQKVQIPQVRTGGVFRPDAQLFSENEYTRLAQTLDIYAQALSLQEKKEKQRQQDLAQAQAQASAQKNGTLADENAPDYPAGAAAGFESFSFSDKIFANAFVSAAQEGAKMQARQEELTRLDKVRAAAPLARTPQELEELFKESRLSGGNENSTVSQSISANLNAALAEEETPQAAAVLAHFSSQLPEALRLGASRRLEARAGERAARQGYQQAVSAGENPALWTQKDIERLTEQHTAKLPEGVRREAAESLSMRAAAARSSLQKQRAGWLKQLLSSAQNGDEKTMNMALFSLAETDPQQDRTLTQAARQVAGNVSGESDPARFNQLYRDLPSRQFNDKKLQDAFSGGKINARDYLILSQERAAINGGGDLNARRLVCTAAERVCRKEGLSGREAEEFKYMVYSLPGGSAEKLSALKKLREIYSL